MGAEFVLSVEKLFSIDREIRAAELGNDKHLVRIKLVDGLKESCFLMQEMLNSDGLRNAKYDPETLQYFCDLKTQGKVDEFLNFERQCLGATGLGKPTVETIVRTLGHVLI